MDNCFLLDGGTREMSAGNGGGSIPRKGNIYQKDDKFPLGVIFSNVEFVFTFYFLQCFFSFFFP